MQAEFMCDALDDLAADERAQTSAELPIGLAWAPSGALWYGARATVPGNGEAGWTVRNFTSMADLRTWAASNPHCAMPCWQNAAAWDGCALI